MRNLIIFTRTIDRHFHCSYNKQVDIYSHMVYRYYNERKYNIMVKTVLVRLPESELEIMQAIWSLNEEGEKFVSAGLIMKRFPELTRLKLTTVLTLITRLQAKGFLKTKKYGRTNCYTPVVPSPEYRRFVSGDFIKKVYHDRKIDLIIDLIDEGLSDEEKSMIQSRLS